MTMSALDVTIDSPISILVKLLKKEWFNRFHPFNRLNTSWKLRAAEQINVLNYSGSKKPIS